MLLLKPCASKLGSDFEGGGSLDVAFYAERRSTGMVPLVNCVVENIPNGESYDKF